MSIKLSVTNQAFYDERYAGELPGDAVDIDSDTHMKFINGLNMHNCIIYMSDGDPTLSPPRPDSWYSWDYDNNTWVMTESAIKNKATEAKNTAENIKNNLMKTASDQISILQDSVDLDMDTDDTKNTLLRWKKYRVMLSQIDTASEEHIEWPESPANN